MIKYKIIIEDDVEGEIYTDSALSLESLEEKFYRIPQIVRKFEKEKLEDIELDDHNLR